MAPVLQTPQTMTEEKLNDELKVVLQELRVALPGMQMLFAFLLTIPFNQGFEKVTPLQRGAFGADLLFTTLSSIFLIAPALYHRLHWRREVKDKDEMLRVINVLAIIGGIFLSLAIVTSIFLVNDFLFGRTLALVASISVAVTCIGAWYALPLIRRAREDAEHRGRRHHPAVPRGAR